MMQYTQFYLNYVELCAGKNKSLSAVAEEIGLSRTSPNGWKKGKLPNDTTRAKLAAYFEITVEQLMGDIKKEKTPVQETEDERLRLEIIEMLSLLDQKELEQVFGYARFLVSSRE